ncbi:hypothetical protein EK904_006953 [Melospiza melodia maxima]|nr:hypothetical protein EK904_006953 [Melospiza melodia maxima]
MYRNLSWKDISARKRQLYFHSSSCLPLQSIPPGRGTQWILQEDTQGEMWPPLRESTMMLPTGRSTALGKPKGWASLQGTALPYDPSSLRRPGLLVGSALQRQWDIVLDQTVPPEERLLWKWPYMGMHLSPSSKAKHLGHTNSTPFSTFCSMAPALICSCVRVLGGLARDKEVL